MTESGAQLFARLDARRCLKDVEPRLFPEHGGPDHGDVVELHGPAGTGKTELLYHLLCRCVMPAAAGGLEVEVMFVDTDYSLDMLRLVSILDRRLTPPNAPLAGDLFVVAAGPGAPPHRQHLCFLLAGPQRGRGQHRQAGGETQQVFASAGPPAQGLPDHGVCHVPRHQEEPRRAFRFLRGAPALSLSPVATVGEAPAAVFSAADRSVRPSNKQRGGKETPGLRCPQHLLFFQVPVEQQLLCDRRRRPVCLKQNYLFFCDKKDTHF
ncbi:unnamed protein product [Tetraodon nigroviridis]|uniref:(spotted green pufferfish) hypothetical protein n=1 Tax=Tetraodon nigroviridis TaxID=99883 RepID=Q4ST80_TETNG|nr:unnamed protein product [Tetraodon nigroviridis]